MFTEMSASEQPYEYFLQNHSLHNLVENIFREVYSESLSPFSMPNRNERKNACELLIVKIVAKHIASAYPIDDQLVEHDFATRKCQDSINKYFREVLKVHKSDIMVEEIREKIGKISHATDITIKNAEKLWLNVDHKKWKNCHEMIQSCIRIAENFIENRSKIFEPDFRCKVPEKNQPKYDSVEGATETDFETEKKPQTATATGSRTRIRKKRSKTC